MVSSSQDVYLFDKKTYYSVVRGVQPSVPPAHTVLTICGPTRIYKVARALHPIWVSDEKARKP